jgi:hypothetical protein
MHRVCILAAYIGAEFYLIFSLIVCYPVIGEMFFDVSFVGYFCMHDGSALLYTEYLSIILNSVAQQQFPSSAS